MKHLGLCCAAMLTIAMPLTAQTPLPASAPANQNRLDTLLKAWEERMTSLDSLATRTTRNDTHPLTKKVTTFVGEAAFLKPDMARIDLTHQDDVGKKDAEKTNFERIYCNGQHIYEYSPREKLIIIHDMPKNNPATDNMILSFLKGMKAANAKQRFGIVLTKETEWYAYLMITPQNAADKQEFSSAQLTIWVKNPNPQGKPNLAMMPARLWYRQPTGKEVTYMFEDMQPNAALNKASFVPTRIPGYEVKTAQALEPAPVPTPKATVREQKP